MVTMVEMPKAAELSSEIAAEPDWAMTATAPGRALAVRVAG